MKVFDVLVLVWDGHALHVVCIPNCLEVAADEQKIDLRSIASFLLLDVLVYFV